MKNRGYFFTLLAAVAMLAGCSKEEPASPGGEKLVLWPQIESSLDGSRVTLSGTDYKWNKNDRIGVAVLQGASAAHNALAGLKLDGSGKAYFETESAVAAAGDRISAYYPYTENVTESDGRVQLPLPALQNQSAAGIFNGSVMPMAAVPTLVPEGGAAELRFVPMASVASFKLWSSNSTYRTEKVHSVMLTASSNIAGTLSVPYTVDDPAAAGAGTDGLVSPTITTIVSEAFTTGSEKDAGQNIYMVVPAMTLSGQVTVRVETDVAAYTFALSNAELVFNRNSVKSFSLDLGSSYAERTFATGWPFAITIYDFMNRDLDGKYGMSSGLIDLIGYSVTLTQPVSKYWVYYGKYSELSGYDNGALIAQTIENGVVQTSDYVFDLNMVQNSEYGVVVVIENSAGQRSLYRTYVLLSRRGSVVSRVWK